MGWWFELIVGEFFCMFVISNELIFNVNQKRERERSMNQGADHFI